jgi:predicted nucleic acid-binding protein
VSPSPLVYDAGALLAAERNDRKFLVLHKTALLASRRVFVPVPVLAQVWRGGSGQQAVLAKVLKGCEVLPSEEDIGKRAGVLLGLSATADAVDAIVVATALKLAATVVTSDPKDLRNLSDAAAFHLGLVEI